MKSKGDDGRVHICPQCEEEFYIAPYQEWGWLVGEGTKPKPVCSYSCQREWEKEHTTKAKPSRQRVAVRIVETGEVFESVAECCRRLNIKRSNLTVLADEGRTYKGLHIERVVG